MTGPTAGSGSRSCAAASVAVAESSGEPSGRRASTTYPPVSAKPWNSYVPSAAFAAGTGARMRHDAGSHAPSSSRTKRIAPPAPCSGTQSGCFTNSNTSDRSSRLPRSNS